MKKLEKDGQVFLIKLGMRIRELRIKKDISQEKFAADCGFDRTYISLVECGKRNLSIANLNKIAQTLGMDVSRLLERLK